MTTEPQLTRSESVRFGLGAMAMLLSFLMFTLIVLDALFTLPIQLPASFYQNRALWIGGAMALIVAAWILQTSPSVTVKRWSPSRPGRRFRALRIYGRNGCHLCDDAVDILEKYRAWLPVIELVDIDDDPALVEKFAEQIPVVELDGRVRFRGRISELLLRRLLEGTPPTE
jgi:hypothetical protein